MSQRKTVATTPININPLWTPEESLNFEVAQNIIRSMIGVSFHKERKEKSKPNPDLQLLAKLKAEHKRLVEELRNLRWDEHEKIEKIFKEYGAEVRAYFQQLREK